MNKKKFEEPSVELFELEAADVITASGGGNDLFSSGVNVGSVQSNQITEKVPKELNLTN